MTARVHDHRLNSAVDDVRGVGGVRDRRRSIVDASIVWTVNRCRMPSVHRWAVLLLAALVVAEAPSPASQRALARAYTALSSDGLAAVAALSADDDLGLP